VASQFGESSVRLLHGLHGLGTLLSHRGEHAEAERLLRQALAIRRSATGPDHPSVADELQNVAQALMRQGRLKEAEALSREALERSRRALGDRHGTVINARLPLLAQILDRQGRHDEADAVFRQALESNHFGDVMVGQMRRDYGRMLLRRGEHARAEAQLLESLALLDRAYRGTDHPSTHESKRALMELYRAWGKPELVERYRVPPGRFVAY
jgi:tetratricopeptide (TPR) repeat protein